MYDYLIVGSGLYGAICAYELNKRGYKVLVIDKRNHIAGNIYTENIENINVHKYGAHIFHTSNKEVWEYINQFAEFNNYINSPIAVYKDEIYNLPFNMTANFFSKITKYLIIEFVPKEDSQVQILLNSREDIFPNYDIDHFKEAYKEYFKIIKEVKY